jgi:glucosamine--fructose-6-phosphate aminotransferase (isomerizing)
MTIMLDEIREEPRSISQTISQNKDKVQKIARILRGSSMVYVTGSGTSYNASVFLSILLLKSGVPAYPLQASDFNDFTVSDTFSNPVNIIFSQSGENIDALSSMKFSKSKNIRTIGITNNPESTLARNLDLSIVTMAGNELSVAATKSHTVQHAVSILIYDALNSQLLDKEMSKASSLVEKAILNDSIVRDWGNKLKDHVVLLGAGLYYPLAMEGALKFKETSGTYSEAYSTREYLHGPIRLLNDQTSVILLRTNENSDNTVIKKINEIGGHVITIGTYSSDITVPQTDNIVLSLEYLSVLQMLANFKAQFKGEDPDHPRHLSKVVRE